MNWTVPRMWDGGECWIIGGGPSIPKQFGVPDDIIDAVANKELPPSAYSPYMTSIHDKHVIGVNMAFRLGDWVDICFFGDRGWFFANRKELAEFPGLKVTCNANMSGSKYDSEYVKYLPRDKNHAKGISTNPKRVSWNANSGAAAISVAIHTGATRIILLGFDMSLGEGHKQHWHGLYNIAGRGKVEAKKLPFNRHLKGFPLIAKEAKKLGVVILNASPDSAIKCFPKVQVKDLLEGNYDSGIKRMAGDFVVPNPREGGKRYNWLSNTITKRGYTIGAEVGCAGGNTTGRIMRRCENLHLYAVDLWGPVPDKEGGGTQYKDWDFKHIRTKFNKAIESHVDRVTVLQGLSWEMADKVEDGSLDFVFIDADHEYESVVKDIKAWTPKLKPGGMLSGHDTHFEEVLKAIKELVPTFKATGVDHVWHAKKEDVLL